MPHELYTVIELSKRGTLFYILFTPVIYMQNKYQNSLKLSGIVELTVMHSELSIRLGSVDAIRAWIGIDLAKYSIGRPAVPMPSKSAIADTS